MEAAVPVVAVFGSSTIQEEDAHYADGLVCGAGLAKAGITVATGGYSGVMEAVSRGAAEAGGAVLGITAPDVFSTRDGANSFVQQELASDTLPRRIALLIDLADAAIALPGSIGTLTELLVSWNLAYVDDMFGREPFPIIAVGGLWRRLVSQIGDSLAADLALVTCVDTVADAVAAATSAVARVAPPSG